MKNLILAGQGAVGLLDFKAACNLLPVVDLTLQCTPNKIQGLMNAVPGTENRCHSPAESVNSVFKCSGL